MCVGLLVYSELSDSITHFGGKGRRSEVVKSGPFNLFRTRVIRWAPDRKELGFGSLEDIRSGIIEPYRPWAKEQYLPDVDPIV